MSFEKNTNVIELYNLVLKKVGHNQRTWYNSGIGTYARPSWKSLTFYRQVIEHKIDLAIAWCVDWSLSISYFHFTVHSFRNFERTILAAYRWLSDNYEEGDCIFLFGALTLYKPVIKPERCLAFSRGAYQIRVLSAMIDKVRYIPSAQVPEINSAGICRSASSLREMRRRYHCALQINFSLVLTFTLIYHAQCIRAICGSKK